MHLRRELFFAASIAVLVLAARAMYASDEAIVATPEISPSGGAYCLDQVVKIADATPNAVIYYTVNGETPAATSEKYFKPITVSKSVTIKAVAVVAGQKTSAVAAATYTMPINVRECVLRRLDVAATNFHSTSADFEFDAVETEPIPDKDVQKGTVYYERKGNSFQMAAHIHELNGKIASKVYSYTSGVFNLYEKLTNQVTRFSKVSQYESYLMLGFGASGKSLEEKWQIKYLGPEVIDGVKTEKLEMVAKDPAARKNIPKVTIWLDTERAVSLKQIFEEGPGQYRVCFYYNFKTNQPLPADAFALKTDKQTVYVNR